jgi:lysophospholipase L1-like esterase
VSGLGLRCAWLGALAAAPLWGAQALRARRRIPRLPEAAGPQEGGTPGADPLRLLFLGESTVAGVGARTQEAGLPGQTSAALASVLGRPVAWQALGRNGVTFGRTRRHLLPALPAQPPAVVLVALGVNDVIGFTRLPAFRREAGRLLEALRAYTRGLLVFAAVPPMGRFPALPQPLRATLGLRARLLDGALQQLAAGTPGCLHVPMDLDVCDPSLMASDGFHPSERGYTAWGRSLAAAIAAQCGGPGFTRPA